MQRMFGRASRTAMAVLVAVSMVTAPFGYSKHSVQNGQRRLLFDHEAHVENLVEESLDNFSMNEFGERINPDTGELSFRHVDIDLPGSTL